MKTRVLALCVLALVGCVPPSLDDVLWRCTSNTDCGDRLVCDRQQNACVPPGPRAPPGEGEGEGEGEVEPDGEGEGEGEGEAGTGTRDDPIVLTVDDELVVRAIAGLASEVCYAITTSTTTRFEVETGGLCAERVLSDTIVDVLGPDLSLVVTNDDGDDIGTCSLATTPELAPARYVFCVYGYEQGAIDATITVRMGERFAAEGEACLRPSVLRGCDPAAVDYNADAVTDTLQCAEGVCEPVYRVAENSPCVVGVDVCEVGDCLLYADSAQPRCGVTELLGEGAACEANWTGTLCGGGTRCRPSGGGMTCQDCVVDGVLLFCGVPRTWAASAALCAEQGLRLPSILDRTEDVDVFDRAEAEFGYEGLYWLGMTDIETEGLYTWIDGRTWIVGATQPYSDWADNEPTNTDEQDCIGTDDDGNWADEVCTAERATICEP